MRPTFQILAGGSDISADVSDRLISLDITDTVDETSDSFTLTLADAEGTLALPASGAKLEVSIGYDGNNQRYCRIASSQHDAQRQAADHPQQPRDGYL